MASEDGSGTLHDQVAVVTGSSSGIGAAIARAMAAAGAAVVVNYRSDEQGARSVATDIEQRGGRALVVQADVSDADAVRAMFARTRDAFGTVDILVNNAGIQQDAAFVDLTLAQWNRVIGVNLTGQFLCAQEAVREFLRRGVRQHVSRAAGKIVCISSVHELIPWAGHVNYAASKGGVMQLMKSMAQELAPQRVRVNGIAPGAIRTDINRGAWQDPKARAALLQLIPWGRVGEPEDIGRAAVWLASDAADYVCGVTLFVDGGMTLYPEFAEGG